MRIGIDGRYIQDHFPGIGRYTYNLVRALTELGEGPELLVLHNPRLTNTRYDLSALAKRPGLDLVEVEVPTFALAEQWRLPALARSLSLNLLHSPYYLKPYVLPCASVVTLYDVIPRRYPEYMPSSFSRLVFELATRLALASSQRAIAISCSTKEDLTAFFQARPERIAVISLAAEEKFRPQSQAATEQVRIKYRLPEGYILYLGLNKPHKNLVRLVEAYSRLATSRPLILAGREDPRYPEARLKAISLGLGERARFLGDIPEEDLPALYSGAALFVFPSLYEGFGLPALEAMACGTPVICSNTSSLPEIAEGVALTFDPSNAEEMAQTMERALEDEGLRQELREKGLARARDFSWERTARETLAVYQEVAGQ